jgi:hypothetical protein
MSSSNPASFDHPELVFGIAGPIGVDMDLIASSLEKALLTVNYSSELIKLTIENTNSQISLPASPLTRLAADEREKREVVESSDLVTRTLFGSLRGPKKSGSFGKSTADNSF